MAPPSKAPRAPRCRATARSCTRDTCNSFDRYRAKRERLETSKILLPESQGQNLALTVLYVPCLLERGAPARTPLPRHRPLLHQRERESSLNV